MSYDPLIWSKVISMSSTASVLRECKISLEFQDFFQKKFFFKTSKYGNSCLYIIDLKTLSGSENFSGLNDLNQHDNITALQIYTAGNGTHVKNVKVTSICRRYYNVEV